MFVYQNRTSTIYKPKSPKNPKSKTPRFIFKNMVISDRLMNQNLLISCRYVSSKFCSNLLSVLAHKISWWRVSAGRVGIVCITSSYSWLTATKFCWVFPYHLGEVSNYSSIWSTCPIIVVGFFLFVPTNLRSHFTLLPIIPWATSPWHS